MGSGQSQQERHRKLDGVGEDGQDQAGIWMRQAKMKRKCTETRLATDRWGRTEEQAGTEQAGAREEVTGLE